MSDSSGSYVDYLIVRGDQWRGAARTAEAKLVRVEAAIRLLGNDDITPQGARILRAALDDTP